MKPKVAIIIPCYKSVNKVGYFFKKLLRTTVKLDKNCDLTFFLINDCCPDLSYKEVEKSSRVKIIHNKKNLGVGASCLIGFEEAMKEGNDIFIKMDSDGQHPAEYLYELIPYLINLPCNELILIKGSRYHFPLKDKRIPILRRFGSLILEPMARASLIYKGLTDIANGFISFNKITLEYLLSKKFNPKIESRYLFECSILKRCSNIGASIHQYPMEIIYGKEWSSSMKSTAMILPIIKFWVKSILTEIIYRYLFQLNLGSLFLLSFISSLIVNVFYLYYLILPNIYANVFVTAGNASFFSASLITSIFLFSLFVIYDNSKKIKVKNIFFKEFVKRI